MEENAMKCQCGGKMKEHKENARFDEGGIDVVLDNVSVWRCPDCAESETAIPQFEQMHQVIASELMSQKGRLRPKEVKFLRKFLGYSKEDFAKKFHVDKATVAHWESPNTRRPISKAYELLLRAMVKMGDTAKEYPLENVATDEPPAGAMHLAFKRNGWRVAAA